VAQESHAQEGHAGECALVRGEDGKEYWKLTCTCGKHVRTPAAIDQPYGRCPKCGRMLKMPGYLHARNPVLISARPGEGPVSAPPRAKKILDLELAAAGSRRDDNSETVDAKAVAEQPMSREAAEKAAARLRQPYAGAAAHPEALGRLSAWPLAGKPARLLAAFIDVTFSTVIAAVPTVLAAHGLLPGWLATSGGIAAVVLAAGILNDGVLQLLIGGSLGKKLVVLVVQTAAGTQPSAGRILLRAVLKWLLIPGWIIGLVDPSERTLHDLLCNTLVLKGRARHRAAHT
jgi:uncharacterized RDD family membrane protein YckC